MKLLPSLGMAAMAIFLLRTMAAPAPVRGFHQEDSAHGQELFEKYCTQCHRLDKEKKGPRLRGVYGRKSGSIPEFVYSDALKKANITWDSGSLDKWLADPDKFIPDNNMDFQVKDPAERAAIIAYLKQLSNQ
jgi:cytochrome c